MFARTFSRLPRLNVVAKVPSRTMAGASRPKGAYVEKTFSEAWLSDAGAYPVMSVIAFAVVFSSCTGLWFMTSHQDSRISKHSRKHLFRGDALRAEEH